MLGLGEENVENSCGLYFILLRLNDREDSHDGLILSILESFAVISLVGVDVPTAFSGSIFLRLAVFGVLSLLSFFSSFCT